MPPAWFPFYFISLWILVLFILSRMGWIHLYREFGSKTPSNGKWLGWFSMKINWFNYHNCVIVYINETGLYMKPMILFRLFHPPMFIPWEQFNKSEERSFFGKIRRQLYIHTPSELTIPLKESQWQSVKHYLKSDQFNQH